MEAKKNKQKKGGKQPNAIEQMFNKIPLRIKTLYSIKIYENQIHINSDSRHIITLPEKFNIRISDCFIEISTEKFNLKLWNVIYHTNINLY